MIVQKPTLDKDAMQAHRSPFPTLITRFGMEEDSSFPGPVYQRVHMCRGHHCETNQKADMGGA